MKDNIMFIPAVVLMIVEAAALVFLICAWRRDKRGEPNDTWKSSRAADR